MRRRHGFPLLLTLLALGCGVLSNKHRASELVGEAQTYLKADDPASAAASAQAARELCPDFLGAYLIAWQSLEQAGQHEKAQAELELALQVNHDDPGIFQVVLILADMKLQQHDAEGALALISREGDALGGHPILLEQKAHLLLQQNQLEAALLAIRQAESMLELDETSALVHGLILSRLGRTGEGVDLLLPFASLAAEEEEWRPDPALAQLLWTIGDQPGMVPLLQGLSEKLPQCRFLRYFVAYCMIGEDRGKEALDLLDTFVTETDFEGQRLRGYALEKLGRVEDAVHALEVALAAAPKPKRADLLTALADIHERMDGSELAYNEVNQALDLNPAHLDALRLLLALEHSHPRLVDSADVTHRLENATQVARSQSLRAQLNSLIQQRQQLKR